LYLSVPFCRSKCTFCNFASGVYPASELPRYVGRLIEGIVGARGRAEGSRLSLPAQVDTIYFGGGTPSILSAGQLRSIFAAISEQFDLLKGVEITLEAAPAMLADDLLAAAVEAGVNRISFGVQTFVDAEARSVGRLHTAAQALNDLERARRAGVRSVSVDLIAGLPGQTEASWRRSLEVVGEAAPEHASVYMLEVDEDSRLGGEMLLGGTRYGAGLTPSDDAVADFYVEACSVLDGHGLAQYEISNFARPGQVSRHNLRYWERRPYLGLGLDAHSMLRGAAGGTPPMNGAMRQNGAMRAMPAPAGQAIWPGGAVRFGTTDELQGYLDGGTGWGEVHRLTAVEELEEAWFLGLRANAGVSLAALRAEFGWAAVGRCEPVLERLAEDGLIRRGVDGVALTPRGRMLSNEVFASFLGITETCAEASEIPSLSAGAR
jgi:oxygen-independent coproporphyrinogen-3 oxidase